MKAIAVAVCVSLLMGCASSGQQSVIVRQQALIQRQQDLINYLLQADREHLVRQRRLLDWTMKLIKSSNPTIEQAPSYSPPKVIGD